MPKPNLTLIPGGAGGSDHLRGGYIRTGIKTAEGGEYIKVSGSPADMLGGPFGGGGDGGGGGVTSLFKLDVHRDVQIAKWGLAGLLTLVGIFFWFVYLPDMKDVRHDVAGINSNVSGISSTVNTTAAAVGRIEDRLDNQAPPQKPAK